MLLVDETYRDLTHGRQLPMAATLSPRAISVASMSKAYGLPGIRIGWAVTTDPGLQETLLAAKEQIVICGSTIDEHIAGRVLADRERILPPILQDVRERASVVQAWMDAQDAFEWVPPSGGVVGLVRFRDGVVVDEEAFYRRLLAEHGTYVGPGHWFELSDRHFRLGFGWPTHAELQCRARGAHSSRGAGERVAAPFAQTMNGFSSRSHERLTRLAEGHTRNGQASMVRASNGVAPTRQAGGFDEEIAHHGPRSGRGIRGGVRCSQFRAGFPEQDEPVHWAVMTTAARWSSLLGRRRTAGVPLPTR